MNAKYATACGLAALLLAACGGQDTPAPAAGARLAGPPAPDTAQPPQLGTALTFDDIARAKPLPEAKPQPRLRMGGAADAPLTLNTQDREAVRHFYNGLYGQSNNVAMGWTGSYATGNAGTVSAAYQQATLLRINWYRAMAGVPANIALLDEYSAKAQQAALMMSANKQLSHTPPSSWTFYTADGAEAAGRSNISLGHAGPDAVRGQFQDAGSNNAAAGHRRWLLYPNTQFMGAGSVPGGTLNGSSVSAANAVWVVGSASATRPAVRDDFVAWPPQGYVPYQAVYGRWSFSYPKADFSKATVQVSRQGVPLGVTLEPLTNNIGESTIVWLLQGTSDGGAMAAPAADTGYTVTVSNVLVGGQPRNFSYTTTVIDPAVPTPGAAATTIAAPRIVSPAVPFSASVLPVAGASGYQFATYRRGTLAAGTLATGSNWSAVISGAYNPAEGNVLHLYHATSANHGALLNRQLLPHKNSKLEFDKQTGLATTDEQLKLQVSTDDGANWTDIYTAAGTGASSSAIEHVQADLSAYAERPLLLRFTLALPAGGGSFYTCNTQCGWRMSNVTISEAEELSGQQTLPVQTGGTASLTVPQTGGALLLARAQYQGRYFGEWGVPAYVNAALVLSGPRSNYTVAAGAGGYTVTDNTGRDGVQTVASPARMLYTDMAVDMDTDGNAGIAYRLYRAALNRTPDAAGLGYWIAVLDNGAAQQTMAAGFTGSAEFQSLYGASPSKEALLTAFYNNVLHRAPDTAGYNYWLGVMNQGLSVENVLLSFSDSPENRAQTAAALQNGVAYIPYR